MILKVLVIVGTVRQAGNGRKIADWHISQARKAAPDLAFERFDGARLDLPFFNEATPPLYHQYSTAQAKVAEKIAAADAFVVVTGEYDHSIPGSLKNFLDFGASEWNRKAAALFGHGGSGAIRSIEHIQISLDSASGSLWVLTNQSISCRAMLILDGRAGRDCTENQPASMTSEPSTAISPPA
jgi:NAD(P)H-dependent FMN reductase